MRQWYGVRRSPSAAPPSSAAQRSPVRRSSRHSPRSTIRSGWARAARSRAHTRPGGEGGRGEGAPGGGGGRGGGAGRGPPPPPAPPPGGGGGGGGGGAAATAAGSR